MLVAELVDEEFGEASAHVRRQVALAHVVGRIHGAEEAKVGVATQRLLVAALVEHYGRARRGCVVEQHAEELQSLARRQVDLVEDDPVAVLYGFGQFALYSHLFFVNILFMFMRMFMFMMIEVHT